MEPVNSNLLKRTMTYGAILGIIVTTLSFLMYVLKIMPVGFLIPSLVIIATVIVYFTGIYISTKIIRTEFFGGFLSFSQGLLIGTLIIFFSSIISSIYNYIQNTIIDPEYMMRVIAAQKDWMINFLGNNGIPDDQIETAINKIDVKMADINNKWSVIKSVMSSTFFGFLLSLISSAMLKRKKDIFSDSVDTNVSSI
jgi:hypothetical protein